MGWSLPELSKMAASAATKAEMSEGVIIAIVGTASAAIAAFVTGMWQWMVGKRRGELDAQSSIINGFIALLGEFKNERAQLVQRIDELERTSQRCSRRVLHLEGIMARHHMKIPAEDE